MRIAILIELQQLLSSGDHQTVLSKIEQLDEKLFASASPGDQARLHSLSATARLNLGRHQEALVIAERGLDLIKLSAENDLIAQLQAAIALCHTENGELSRAERMYRDLIATYRRIEDIGGVIRTLNRLARVYFIRGAFERVVEILLEAKDYAEQTENVKRQAMILGNLGTVFNLTGRFTQANDYLQESIELNLSLGNHLNLCRAHLSTAYAQMHLRSFDSAARNLDEAMTIIAEHGFIGEQPQACLYRSELALLQGDAVQARQQAEQALRLADPNAAGPTRGQAQRLLAEAYLMLGEFSSAERWATTALATAESTEERVEIGAAQRVLAISAARSQRADQAQQALRQAVATLSDCGANFELAQTWLAWSRHAIGSDQRALGRQEADRLFMLLGISDLYLTRQPSKRPATGDVPVIGSSTRFQNVLRQTEACVEADIPMLLQGETGSGKDQLAKYIHSRSPRTAAPFIVVNCAAIPLELAESELFGYEKGAFTNANSVKTGLIEAADGGTLFLNEIGDLPFEMQAKLLAVLDEKRFFKLGSTTERRVDFRLIAATNVDLQEAVANGTFRPDLYYRLAVINLHLPRLAERGGDVFELFEHFLADLQVDLRQVAPVLSNELKAAMLSWEWPGNIRELRNYVELFALTESRDATAICQRLLNRLRNGGNGAHSKAGTLTDEVQQFERSRIHSALEITGGVIRRAAVRLGLPEATLRSKMKKYEISAA
jgi:transcriptional regulator with PAS, ATPase and Fis domain